MLEQVINQEMIEFLQFSIMFLSFMGFAGLLALFFKKFGG